MHMDELNLLTEEILHNVPHIQQKYDWDCGIACVSMAVSNRISPSNLEETIRKLQTEPNEGFGQRPWTIDLCHILSSLNVPHEYFTTSIDVNPNLKRLPYYTNSLKKDGSRVSNLLSNSRLQESIHKESLNNHRFVYHLKNGPMIVLVDGNKLKCMRCQIKSNWAIKSCWNGNATGKFVGHYIVVVGYSPKSNQIYFRDPSLTDQICAISFQAFNEARLAMGTDEDIILIHSQTTEIPNASGENERKKPEGPIPN
ncbi:unnamed protein product [Orchesella dallaii]|uniref:Protein GUCD1 n=1 Tax=Orchesella dallaii TaxID=48710 RepID=A0ABP1PVT1_9HEXA